MGVGYLTVVRIETGPEKKGGGGLQEDVLEGGGEGGVWDQKWPNKIFPFVNFGFSHCSHFGRGAPGGGTPPVPNTVTGQRHEGCAELEHARLRPGSRLKPPKPPLPAQPRSTSETAVGRTPNLCHP